MTMRAVTHTGTLLGIESHIVEVEVRSSRGLPKFEIVGLPEAAVREARVRVSAAIESCGYSFPKGKVVLNLVPADLRKTGSGFDLAIAISVLTTTGSCAPNRLPSTLLLGELTLSGELRATRGILAHIQSAQKRDIREFVIPEANARDVAGIEGLQIRSARHLSQVVEYFNGHQDLPLVRESSNIVQQEHEDLSDVCGQAIAKRALEIAAAGAHHLLFIGSPGAGKTMLASRLPSILPRPSATQWLEIATIRGVSGLSSLQAYQRPFRSPHHSTSDVGLIGGGAPIMPGEVTLAHQGVLFLDELTEFRRSAIESLRTCMESGVVYIVRSQARVCMPANALVVAATNPCPCGYFGDPSRICRCSQDRVERYLARISGPLLDRFDLQVPVRALALQSVESLASGESSAAVRKRVVAARAFRKKRSRFFEHVSKDNHDRVPEILRLLDQCDKAAQSLLTSFSDRLSLSARGSVRALRVARTIADLEQSAVIMAPHVGEALQYRMSFAESPTGHQGKLRETQTENKQGAAQ